MLSKSLLLCTPEGNLKKRRKSSSSRRRETARRPTFAFLIVLDPEEDLFSIKCHLSSANVGPVFVSSLVPSRPPGRRAGTTGGRRLRDAWSV